MYFRKLEWIDFRVIVSVTLLFVASSKFVGLATRSLVNSICISELVMLFTLWITMCIYLSLQIQDVEYHSATILKRCIFPNTQLNWNKVSKHKLSSFKKSKCELSKDLSNDEAMKSQPPGIPIPVSMEHRNWVSFSLQENLNKLLRHKNES